MSVFENARNKAVVHISITDQSARDRAARELPPQTRGTVESHKICNFFFPYATKCREFGSLSKYWAVYVSGPCRAHLTRHLWSDWGKRYVEISKQRDYRFGRQLCAATSVFLGNFSVQPAALIDSRSRWK